MRAATPAEAAAAGTVPHLPADALAGRIVIDANNYYRLRDGVITELETGRLTTGELFQRYVPGVRTVKTFSTIYFLSADAQEIRTALENARNRP
ncbi:hypothetical protein [Streptomyces sp. NPDC051001]|uniref:hypothetical protein n=1 Tax=Streptomyces sp. NPDC051001 TaxID=3155795 RepID=UPI00342005BD